MLRSNVRTCLMAHYNKSGELTSDNINQKGNNAGVNWVEKETQVECLTTFIEWCSPEGTWVLSLSPNGKRLKYIQ